MGVNRVGTSADSGISSEWSVLLNSCCRRLRNPPPYSDDIRPDLLATGAGF